MMTIMIQDYLVTAATNSLIEETNALYPKLNFQHGFAKITG